MKTVCTECGTMYEYRSDNPRGSTPSLCNACQKKSAKFRKKLKLMLISGNGELNCRCCGYRKSAHALTSRQARSFLIDNPSPEEEAKASYLVCLNCNARIEAGELRAEPVNTKIYPVSMRFYETRVIIEDHETKDHIRTTSEDAVELEITNEEPRETRKVSQNISRLETTRTIDVPAL